MTLPAPGDFRPHDMLGNWIRGDRAGSTESLDKSRASSVSLEQGRPVYLMSAGPSAKEFAESLRRAEIGPLGERFPIQTSASKTAATC